MGRGKPKGRGNLKIGQHVGPVLKPLGSPSTSAWTGDILVQSPYIQTHSLKRNRLFIRDKEEIFVESMT